MPFLLKSPSPVSQSMGGTGVALPTDDAFGMYYNPALTGLSAEETNLSVQFYPVKHTFYPSYSDIYSKNIAVNAGFNLKSITGGLPLSVGVGYMNQYMDLGEITRIYENGTVIGKFRSKEYANTFSASAALDLWVKLGFGLSVKSISSHLASPSLLPYESTGTTTAYDLGLIAVAPVVKDLRLFDQFSTNINISIGYSLINLGNNISYTVGTDTSGNVIIPTEKDPLPRNERLGYGLNFALKYDLNDTKIKVLEFALTGEGEALLAVYDSSGYHYKSILSNINIWNNVIKAKSDYNVNGRFGWSVNLFETLSMSGGHYKNLYSYIGYEFSTTGFSIQTSGITKLLKSFSGNPILGFVADHFNLRYNYAEIKSTLLYSLLVDPTPLYGNYPGDYYNGIELIVKGFSF